MNIPGYLRQGDTWEWNDCAQVDPQGNALTSPTYTLHYVIRSPSLKLQLDGAVGTYSGNGWTFTATPAQTELMLPGDYEWMAWADSAALDKFTCGHGTTTITPDLTTQAAGTDNRSQAKQIIDQIDAAIMANQFVVEYSIAGRTVRREGISQMMQTRDFYAAIYGREVANARIRQGLGDPRKSYAMFGPRAQRFGWW